MPVTKFSGWWRRSGWFFPCSYDTIYACEMWRKYGWSTWSEFSGCRQIKGTWISNIRRHKLMPVVCLVNCYIKSILFVACLEVLWHHHSLRLLTMRKSGCGASQKFWFPSSTICTTYVWCLFPLMAELFWKLSGLWDCNNISSLEKLFHSWLQKIANARLLIYCCTWLLGHFRKLVSIPKSLPWIFFDCECSYK